MSLKEIWKNKIDGVDDVLAKDINDIAHQAIENENSIQNLNTKTQENAENIEDLSLKTQKNEASIIQLNTDLIINKEEIAEHESKIENLETLRIIPKVGGSLISLSDSAETGLAGLKIYGESEQFSTTGKNKLPYPYTNTTLTSSGITFTDNGDGTVTCNGTAEESVFFRLRDLTDGFMISAGEYTLSGCPSGGSNSAYHLYCVNKSQSAMTLNDVGNGATATLASDETYACYIKISKGQTVSGITFKPMLRPVDTDDTYEPYTGGEAFPNPNYPQEITSVGDSGSVDLKLQGENLLEYEAGTTVSRNGGTFVVNDDMSITASGTPIQYIGLILYDGEVIHEDLTIGCDGLTATTNIGLNVELRKDGTLIATKAITSLSGSDILTVAKSDLINIDTLIVTLKRAANNSTMSGTVYPILTAGTYDGIWEPPKPLQSATFETPDGLRSIPNTDIRDEIDLERGVRVQRVGVKELTGDEIWTRNNTEDSTIVNFCSTISDVKNNGSTSSKALCSHLVVDVHNTWYGKTHGCYFANKVLHVFLPEITDLAEFKAILAEQYANGTPFTIYYELETPIETPLTDEEIAAYKALHTYKPNTTIYNSEGADMEVKYVADTKLYIDNKIEKAVAELSAAIITE